MLFIARFDHTARKPKVKFEIMAEMKPYQLKDSSAAEAIPTPTMMGSKEAITGRAVASPSTTLERMTLKAGSKVLTVCVSEMATAANERLAAT